MTIGWHFDNTYSKLSNTFKENIKPTPVHDPELVILNEELASTLNLDFSKTDKKKLAEIFSGNSIPEETNTIAQAYAGHQFGHFTMLGDGRAVLLGEHLVNNDNRFDIQFKGSGRTSFSRGGDGRAALGPMLREYIISEAIHSLNIPTTRSLAVVKTGEKVVRENLLQGAILTRVASSHLRVGTFQYIAATQNTENLNTLVDYTINRHYPEIKKSNSRALDLLNLVMEKQCQLVINWMRVGFIHGVMNTDNMAISGETIDYGPCAFMDHYDPKTVFSSIDKFGRYAFSNQPPITKWNLARFAECLIPLIDKDEDTAIKLATDTKTSFGAKSRGNAPGIELDIALPIHPAFDTTIAETGKIKRTLNAAAFLPSLTLLAAIKRIIKPWFKNKKPIDPATPSCQKIPMKLKSGGSLKFAKGSFSCGDKLSHNAFKPEL